MLKTLNFNRTKIINCIFLISIFSTNFFFSFASMVGYEHSGLENGSYLYWAFFLFQFIFSLSYLLVKLLKKKRAKKKMGILIYFILLFIIWSWFYPYLFNISPLNISTIHVELILFILFSVPAIIAAWYFFGGKDVNRKMFLQKNTEIIMLIFTLGSLSSSYRIITNLGVHVSIGGGSYQNLSYISAYAFALNLYYIMWGNKIIRHEFTKNMIYRFIQVLLLLLQLLAVFIGGGRGAFVLLFVAILIYSLLLFQQNNITKYIKYFIYFLTAVIIGFFLFNLFLRDNEIIKNGFMRTTAFISTKGVNWDGTSGRDLVYQKILLLFKGRPILGNGFFNYPLPHNIFLEILVSTGVVGFTFFFILFIFFIKKIYLFIKKDEKNILLLAIFLYPLVMLMFSGSLFKTSEFWFVVTTILFQKNINVK